MNENDPDKFVRSFSKGRTTNAPVGHGVERGKIWITSLTSHRRIQFLFQFLFQFFNDGCKEVIRFEE